jgi:uncharacterized membrane protein
MKLTKDEKSQIDIQVARVEASTGVQVLAVIAGKSDTYPEIPWKAFSLGVSLATLVLALVVPVRFAWSGLPTALSAIVVLGTGLVLALATVFLRPAARLFLGDGRATAETRQFALSFFFERDLSRTRSRNALLVLVSQLERRAAVVADTGIIKRIPQRDLDGISAIMDDVLARRSASVALTKGLTALEELLRTRGFSEPPAAGDEIAEEFLETEGPKT